LTGQAMSRAVEVTDMRPNRQAVQAYLMEIEP
jgi:hypothetical protein